jgi:glycerol-3-phosphate dehydrogenase (NAD+)
MVGKIKESAIGLSLIKGFDTAEGGGMELISHIITKHLKVSSLTDYLQFEVFEL